MSSSSSGVSNKMKRHSQYSTFIDNENYCTNSGENNKGSAAGENSSSSTNNTPRPPYSKRQSTSSLHSTYALPPLPDPDAPSPSEIQKTKNGTTSHTSTRSKFGNVMIRLGTACCPCLSPARVVSSTPTGGSVDWLWAFGRRLLLAVSLSSTSRSEDSRLLQRTASEEEILSKRPRFVKKNSGNSSMEKSNSATSDQLRNNENEPMSKSSSKISRHGSNDTGILSPERDEIDEEEDSLCSLASTKSAMKGSGVIPKDPARKRRSRRDQAKIAKNVGKGKPGPSGVVSARFRPPHEIQRTSSASAVISQNTAKSRPNDLADSSTYSKSATPSPAMSGVDGRGGRGLPHGVQATKELLRDFRESSVNSRSSTGSTAGVAVENTVISPQETEFYDVDAVASATRDQKSPERYPSPYNNRQFHHGSMSSLGSRTESMASIYSQEGGRFGTVTVRGDVEVGMSYSLKTQSLELLIKQCRDLACVDAKRNRSDPYVKVYLLPDRSKSGKRKTKVKKHTINPVFDEVLKFHMPLDEIERRTLWISVWHSDMFGRNDFLGEVMLPMAGQIVAEDSSPKWYSLQERTDNLMDELSVVPSNYRGEIIVALKFIPPPRQQSSNYNSKQSVKRRSSQKGGVLMILVKEAKNLVSPKGSPDPFCKCYLLPEKTKSMKQKTSVCRKTTSPRWESALSWDDISLSDLSERCLELTVWDHDRIGHNDILGGVRFNLGTGHHLGRRTNWMDASGKEVTLWQQMLDRPNFWVEGSLHLRPAEKIVSNKPSNPSQGSLSSSPSSKSYNPV